MRSPRAHCGRRPGQCLQEGPAVWGCGPDTVRAGRPQGLTPVQSLPVSPRHRLGSVLQPGTVWGPTLSSPRPWQVGPRKSQGPVLPSQWAAAWFLLGLPVPPHPAFHREPGCSPSWVLMQPFVCQAPAWPPGASSSLQTVMQVSGTRVKGARAQKEGGGRRFLGAGAQGQRQLRVGANPCVPGLRRELGTKARPGEA